MEVEMPASELSAASAVVDIADWLRRPGLERYAASFRDNDIDDAVLRRLTAEDLRDLGVAAARCAGRRSRTGRLAPRRPGREERRSRPCR
jgi:hypothetical protein